jgi:hypothetical protein
MKTTLKRFSTTDLAVAFLVIGMLAGALLR